MSKKKWVEMPNPIFANSSPMLPKADVESDWKMIWYGDTRSEWADRINKDGKLELNVKVTKIKPA